MSTHNIPFSIKKRNNFKLSLICSYGIFFQGTQERVRNSCCKPAITVQATEILLYCANSLFWPSRQWRFLEGEFVKSSSGLVSVV